MKKSISQSIRIVFIDGRFKNHSSIKEFEIKEVGSCAVLYIYTSDNCVYIYPMSNIEEIIAEKFPLKV